MTGPAGAPAYGGSPAFWLVSDTLLIFAQQTKLSLRYPLWLIIGTSQPVLYLVLYGPLLSNLSGSAKLGEGSAWQLLVPGLLVQLSLFGTAFVGVGIFGDMFTGALARMAVTPVSRFALLLGRVFRDTAFTLLQSVILVLTGLAFGLHVTATGFLIGLALIGIESASVSALSYGLALLLKTERVLSPLLNSVILPIPLLSGIILPLTLAPVWLSTLSGLNPFRYFVDAIRAAYLGHYSVASIWEAAAVGGVMLVLCFAFGSWGFRRVNR